MQIDKDVMWLFIRPLVAENLMIEVQDKIDYIFPLAFLDIVKKYNGAIPKCNQFDTQKMHGRIFKVLLSFNKNDVESIWNIIDSFSKELLEIYIPFASDPFGNHICFNKSNSSIIFLNHENNEVEFIDNNIEIFLNKLYI